MAIVYFYLSFKNTLLMITITKLIETRKLHNAWTIFMIKIISNRMVLSFFYIPLSDCNWKVCWLIKSLYQIFYVIGNSKCVSHSTTCKRKLVWMRVEKACLRYKSIFFPMKRHSAKICHLDALSMQDNSLLSFMVWEIRSMGSWDAQCVSKTSKYEASSAFQIFFQAEIIYHKHNKKFIIFVLNIIFIYWDKLYHRK